MPCVVRLRRCFAGGVLVPIVALSAPAQQVVASRFAERIPASVTAAGTGEALVGVTVTVVGTRLGSITADDGHYTIANVPDGTHLLYARRLGFGQDSQTVVVVTGQTVTANFALRTVGVQLSPVV